MDKNIKRALKTGVDENNNKLSYYCPQCGWEISLMPKRCPKCGAKRPKDAYLRATELRDAASSANVDNAVCADRSADRIPSPKAPCYATETMAQMRIPKYYTSDEYGRVFETPVCYKTLPGGGPVPVPKPSKNIQTEAIKIPLEITK